jgi:hypothetical protein
MNDVSHFAVYRNAPANDARAERFADRLMSETDAEERHVLFGLHQSLDQIDAAAGARRRARAGRDHDRARIALDQRLRLERVVANDGQRDAGEALDLLD